MEKLRQQNLLCQELKEAVGKLKQDWFDTNVHCLKIIQEAELKTLFTP